jgi:hypothetical protein
MTQELILNGYQCHFTCARVNVEVELYSFYPNPNPSKCDVALVLSQHISYYQRPCDIDGFTIRAVECAQWLALRATTQLSSQLSMVKRTSSQHTIGQQITTTYD